MEGEPKPGSPLKSNFPSPEETCTSLRQLQPVPMQEDHLSPGQLVLLHSHPVRPFGASHHEQLVYIATMKLNCGRLSNCNEVISRWQHEKGIKNLVCSGLWLQGDRSWCCTGYITARLAEVTVITLRLDLFLGTWFYTVAANTIKALGAGGSSMQQLSPRHYFILNLLSFHSSFCPQHLLQLLAWTVIPMVMWELKEKNKSQKHCNMNLLHILRQIPQASLCLQTHFSSWCLHIIHV